MTDSREPFFESEDIASATECTGLMPSLPQDQQQNINEAELYGVHKAKKPSKKSKKR
jgi:hypothetical protein